ncbi:hypothetical protein EPUL_003361, partial [Erysiphe pulchra]
MSEYTFPSTCGEIDSLNSKNKQDQPDDRDQPDDMDPFSSKVRDAIIEEKETARKLNLKDIIKIYNVKSIIINGAIQDIGMGYYNWKLFILCGISWLTDNLWLQILGLTLKALNEEFKEPLPYIRYVTCVFFVGLCFGAIVGGVITDVMGRKFCFKATLLIIGIFGTALGAAPSWPLLCLLYLLVGIGVGGNIPVADAIFLEFLPQENGQYLSLLSAWWPLGQLVACLFSWCFMKRYFVPKSGWRYSCYAAGIFTCLEFLGVCFFNYFESPKYLLSRGQQNEAIEIVKKFAGMNKNQTWLSGDVLNKEVSEYVNDSEPSSSSQKEIFYYRLKIYFKNSLTRLFETSEMAWNTSLLFFCWFSVGLAYPLFNDFLPQYLSTGRDSSGGFVPDNTIYLNYTIISVVSIPGSFLASLAPKFLKIGQRRTMAVSTLIAGILLLIFIISDLNKFQLGISAAQGFFQQAMYAVLFAYTTELFPAPVRGTGLGISEFLNRIGGLLAAIIAANISPNNSPENVANNPRIPAIVSGICYVGAFVAMLLLPIETMNRQKLNIPVHNHGSSPEKADAKELPQHPFKKSGQLPIDELRAEINSFPYLRSYDIKCIVINKAIEDVGMGRYNWSLFLLCGFGWFADNLWLQQLALTLPSLSIEFDLSENYVRYTTCYLFSGLCLGSIFWGMGSDIMGRRIAFNITLFIAGVFGASVGAAPTWPVVCVIYFALGTGVGGSLPVDGALFLEFLPNTSGRLLTLMSIWWPLGQLVSSISGWGFMGGNYAPNLGWRYSCYSMGSIILVMFLARFFLFHLYESPKFLLARGSQAEAVAVVRGIADKNGTTTWLTEDILNELGGYSEPNQPQVLSRKEIFLNRTSNLSINRVGPLFATSMGYPLFNSFLPQYLSMGETSSGEPVSEYITYRNYVITSIMGIPGSIVACYIVDLPFIGRRGTMAISTLVSSILIFLFTISRDASFQLGFSVAQSFFQNIMYAVLYSYTPEVFPTAVRGTGTGIGSLLNRIGGLCAPIVAANVPVGNPNVPIF